jgi:hypothetical protein
VANWITFICTGLILHRDPRTRAVDCRRRLPQGTSAALIRESHGGGTLIRVVFMDERQQPLPVDPGTMMATAYLAAELDDDLHQAFGSRNVIVLK